MCLKEGNPEGEQGGDKKICPQRPFINNFAEG